VNLHLLAGDRVMSLRERRRNRRVLRIAVLVLATALAAWLLPSGPRGGPWGRTPGFALAGEPEPGHITSWEFVRAHPEIALETRTPWFVRHSVTVAWLLQGGDLFIPSRSAARKRWVGHVLRQPEVRLRIGERIYEARLERVDDPATRERLLQAASEKWPHPTAQDGDASATWFFRVEPR
jgi:hypothetical protein